MCVWEGGVYTEHVVGVRCREERERENTKTKIKTFLHFTLELYFFPF